MYVCNQPFTSTSLTPILPYSAFQGIAGSYPPNHSPGSLSFMDPLFLIIVDMFCTYAFLAGLYGSV
jgi:hypothetical protein